MLTLYLLIFRIVSMLYLIYLVLSSFAGKKIFFPIFMVDFINEINKNYMSTSWIFIDNQLLENYFDIHQLKIHSFL